MSIEIASIGLAAAFAAGLVSFLSPCVLPLVPGYLSYVAGRSLDDIVAEREVRARFHVQVLSLFFVSGFSAVFVAMGASASAVGRLMQAYRFEANYIAGAIIILFGLHMMGLLRFSWLNRDWRFFKAPPRGRPLGAFLLGTAFAFGWTPCIGPILGSILTIGAVTASVSDGVILLGVYSAGLAIPFLLVALFTDRFMGSAKSLRRFGRPAQAIAGGILVVAGIAMWTGYLTAFGTWLLATFPVFQAVVL
jgi:cytochrome c-type biogenesis protein